MKQWAFAMLEVDTRYHAEEGICSSVVCQDWLPEGSNPAVHLNRIKKMKKGSPCREARNSPEYLGTTETDYFCSLRSSGQRRVWKSAGLLLS